MHPATPQTIFKCQYLSQAGNGSSLDGIANLKLTSKAIPLPDPGEVLVKIHTVSLNYKDGETIEGLFNHHAVKTAKTIVPCGDAAGVVNCVGEGVRRWKEGDPVLSIPYPDYLTGRVTQENLRNSMGTSGERVLCEWRIFKEDALLPNPKGMADVEACTLQVAVVTAWMAVNGSRPLGSLGGKGKIAKASGAEGMSYSHPLIPAGLAKPVIITSSSDEKLARAKALGADHLINYSIIPDWDEQVLLVTNGRGAGLFNAIDHVSGKVDPEERLNINVQAIRKNVALVGILHGPRDRFEEMLEFYEKSEIKLVVDRVFAFEDAKEALECLWSGSHFGKVVIKMSD